MVTFFYTTLILCIGLGNKLIQGISGEYAASDLILDLPLIVFTYFGLIALWGRAKQKRYFSEAFWRIYFIALMASLIVLPVLDPSIRLLMHEFGLATALAAYAVMVVILMPYYWALYSYAYGKKRVWLTA